MSEQESAWYYTQHGERKGPVTLEVLRGAIEHRKIDREKDLIWGPGLSDWVTMDKVPELQGMPAGPPPVVPAEAASEAAADAAAPPAETPVKESVKESVETPAVSSAPASAIASAAKPIAANPYESPESLEDDNALADAMAARREGGGSSGIGRLGYFLWSLLLNVGGIIAAVAMAGKYSNEVGDSGPIIAVLGAVFVVVVVGLLVSLSRLKNLSMSRWNILWSLVPFANIWLGFRMIACPAGYGQHKKLDVPGKVMLVLFILYILGCMVTPVLLSGASSDKEAADQAYTEEQQRAEEVGAE